jgi:hypothetical protein
LPFFSCRRWQGFPRPLCLSREEGSARSWTRQPSRVHARGHRSGFCEEEGRRRLDGEVVELGGVATVKVRAHSTNSRKTVQLLTYCLCRSYSATRSSSPTKRPLRNRTTSTSRPSRTTRRRSRSSSRSSLAGRSRPFGVCATTDTLDSSASKSGRPFYFSALSRADVSIPSTAACPSPSSPRSHSSTSATRARSFSIGSCHLYRHRPPGHHNLSGRANVSYKSGYLQPRGASRICPYFKELPLTSLSFHLPADLFQDILYLRYSRSLS